MLTVNYYIRCIEPNCDEPDGTLNNQKNERMIDADPRSIRGHTLKGSG